MQILSKWSSKISFNILMCILEVVISGSTDSTIQIFSATEGYRAAIMKGAHSGAVLGLDFVDRGRNIVCKQHHNNESIHFQSHSMREGWKSITMGCPHAICDPRNFFEISAHH